MINIDNLKLALFDFDDTLCIHKNHQTGSEEEYFKKILLGQNAWETCETNIHLKYFMEELIKRNIKLGLISTTVSFKHMEAKQKWVEQNYGIKLENYCVNTFENKLMMMKAISNAFNILPEEILIVDDLYENIERAANNNFQACTPIEVVNYVEKYILKRI